MRMNIPSIKSAIESLGNFKNSPIDLSGYLNQLRKFHRTGQVDPKVAEDIRKALNNLLSENPEVDRIIENSQILGNALRHSLFALADIAPLNLKDPILHSEIEEDHRVVVSTGHQFNLKALINWHNTREWSEEEKSEEFKPLINPITREILPDHDFLYIRAVAADRGIMFFQDIESDLAGIELLSPQQQLHPFILELDRLSGNKATHFLKKWGYVDNDTRSILTLSSNTFHCASTPAIRDLVEISATPLASALSFRIELRLLLQNVSILNLLQKNDQPPSFLLSLETIEVERLVNTAERSPELMQFLLDQKWPIKEILSLNDPHRDLLEFSSVRQLLLDHKVQAEQFKNFRQYYKGCRCGGPCNCFFSQKEFVKALKAIADYRSLIEPIASIDDALAGLRGVRNNAYDTMKIFEKKVMLIEQIKVRYHLDTEAACAFYNNPEQIMVLVSAIFRIGSTFNYDVVRNIIAFFSTPLLSVKALNELDNLPKNWKQYHAADKLLENWARLDSNGEVVPLDQIPRDILCFTEQQRDGLQFLVKHKTIEAALLSSLSERGEGSNLRSVLAALADWRRQNLLERQGLMEVLLEQASVTLWDIVYHYSPDQIARLYFHSKQVVHYLEEKVLTLNDIFSLADDQWQLLVKPEISTWIKKGLLTVQEACSLSADQVRSIINPTVLSLYEEGILTKEQILSLNFTEAPWSLGFAIESGLFTSGFIKTLEEAVRLSEAEMQLYCHPVACSLMQNGRATFSELLALNSEQQKNLGVGKVTFNKPPKGNPYCYRLSDPTTKILALMEVDSSLRVGKILAASGDTLSTWYALTSCDIAYKAIQNGIFKLDDPILSSFTNQHRLCLADQAVLNCIARLDQSWTCILQLTENQLKQLSQRAYQEALEHSVVISLIKSNQLTIAKILDLETWKLPELLNKQGAQAMLSWFQQRNSSYSYYSGSSFSSSYGLFSRPAEADEYQRALKDPSFLQFMQHRALTEEAVRIMSKYDIQKLLIPGVCQYMIDNPGIRVSQLGNLGYSNIAKLVQEKPTRLAQMLKLNPTQRYHVLIGDEEGINIIRNIDSSVSSSNEASSSSQSIVPGFSF